MRCVEFVRCVLQNALQSVSLVEDLKHCSFDRPHEKAYRLPSAYKGFCVDKRATDGYDAGGLIQKVFNKASTIDSAEQE